jgi:hypothetical protein
VVRVGIAAGIAAGIGIGLCSVDADTTHSLTSFLEAAVAVQIVPSAAAAAEHAVVAEEADVAAC